MVRGALHRLGARLRLVEMVDSDDSDDSGDSDTSRFVPSVLDASVRYAHGGSKPGLESEIAQLEEKGRILEKQQRER
ncbi:hypothetical protein [Halorientalis sp.]|uniref:hypothetical protein n=1 Tax=Halorientalis sp. TaxID=1931229 RepID=UPI00260D073E|nr:hypothetical protein [Halorientalis sp.]